MLNKALRILIADEQHFHRLKTERLFNQLGYYRVAPVQSLADMLNLVEYGCEPFDLVVINASLAAGALDLSGFLRDNRQVHHALIYDDDALPDLAAIRRLMELIDPPACEAASPLDQARNRQRIG
ncbi:chemotaxis protein CheY [Pseudomonas frederiksbergensis]|uniref:Chemotaxis protein CheY n=1 Tax=Pseudomonas frederiksbergensis TaxID=104087 RepID=A0A2S8HJJ5_9PSED|nr:chemotaxis protein CheY [Pseudomonas frederiksbergensis]PQP02681.1 chemotaxis protein CheY [Pseudomonas frederiksbergensis]